MFNTGSNSMKTTEQIILRSTPHFISRGGLNIMNIYRYYGIILSLYAPQVQRCFVYHIYVFIKSKL